MPKYHVYYDTRIRFCAVMTVEAPDEDHAQDVANITPPDLTELGPEHIIDVIIDAVVPLDSAGEEVRDGEED